MDKMEDNTGRSSAHAGCKRSNIQILYQYINRYEEEGLGGLTDKRLTQTSSSQAPLDEVKEFFFVKCFCTKEYHKN